MLHTYAQNIAVPSAPQRPTTDPARVRKYAGRFQTQDAMTINEFFTTYPMSSLDAEWAIENCASMKDVWDTACPRLVIEIATGNICRDGKMRPVLTDKELYLFNAASIRYFEKEITDKASIEALSLLEKLANGKATKEEFMKAWQLAPADMWTLSITKGTEESQAYQANWLRNNTKPRL